MSLVFDEFGRPYILVKDQNTRSRLKGLDAQKANIKGTSCDFVCMIFCVIFCFLVLVVLVVLVVRDALLCGFVCFVCFVRLCV